MRQPSHPALRGLFKVDTAIAYVESGLLVAAFVVMLLLYFFNVVLRNISASLAAPWLTDLPQQMVLWVTLFGASLAARRGRHINIEVAGRLLPQGAQRWAKLFMQLAGISMSIVLVVGSYRQLMGNEVPKGTYVTFATLGQGFAAGCFCPTGQNLTAGGTCEPVSPDPCRDWQCSEPQKGICSVVAGKPQCLCEPGFREDAAGFCRGPEALPCGPQSAGGETACPCDPGYVPDASGAQCVPGAPPQCALDTCKDGGRTLCAEVWSAGTEVRVPTWVFALLLPLGFVLMTLHFVVGALIELIEGFLPGAETEADELAGGASPAEASAGNGGKEAAP